MVEAANPVTVNDWEVPLTRGVGSPVNWVAELQLPLVITEVERLISYVAAVPAVPSSPGDVQLRVIDVWVILGVLRLVIWDGAVVSGAGCTVYEPVWMEAQQFLLVPVFDTHLDVYDPEARPVQLKIKLFPELLLNVHWLELPLEYASIQSYPEEFVGQIMVNAWLAMGLAGLITGTPSPQSLQDGEEMENDIVKSLVLALLDASIHLT